jgi:4-hydroxy-3-polyprenylbenzoate decarboxylase
MLFLNEGDIMKIVVGMTGASGSIYTVRLLEVLREAGCEIHFVASESGWQVIEYECGLTQADIEKRVSRVYDVNQIGSAIASGSFRMDAMVIVPCSMRTLGGIANGMADNLLMRAADVAMKEGRPLYIVPRETPLSAIHLENMLKLARLGVRIIPAMPGFYHRPKNMDELINMMVGKICDQIGVEHTLFERWQG